MAKLLNREQLVFEIEEIFCKASEYIYLICPYIELGDSSSLLMSLENASNKGIDINVIYSKGFKKNAGQEKLKNYKRVKLCYVADLHMKVYK